MEKSDKMIPLDAVDLMAQLMEGSMRATQSVTRQLEENVQDDAIRARDMVVSMIDKLWELSDAVDSHRLHCLVGDFAAHAQARGYYRPFYYETEEHKARMDEIDNGNF